MSHHASDADEAQDEDPSQTHTSEGMPGALWGQIPGARQASRSSQTRDRSSSIVPRVADLPHNAPASLRLLAATAERMEHEQLARNAGMQFEDRMNQFEAMRQMLDSRSRALREGRRETDPVESVSGEENAARQESPAPMAEVTRQEELRMAAQARARPRPTESLLQQMEREHREGHRVSITGLLDSSTADSSAILRPAASNLLAATEVAPSTDSSGAVERSTSARRDLERALRDYRIARRALRSHYTNEPGSPAEQNTPSYQGVIAQIAEQQSNSRSRMRARGQSRTNTLERTDAIVDRIAAAAGVGNDAWRSDDDGDTVVGPPTTTATTTTATTTTTNTTPPATQQLNSTVRPVIRGTRNVLSPIITTSTTNPYLGPNTSARAGSISTGGMRDFYQRVEDRQRNPGRASLGTPRAFPPFSRLNEYSSEAGATHRPSIEEDREQRSRDALQQFNSSVAELQAKTGKSSYNTTKIRAKRTLKYLSDLKKLNNNRSRGIALAQELGIDSLADGSEKERTVDLPSSIRELERPQPSSWLEAGVSWEGMQKGGVAKPDGGFFSLNSSGTGPLFEPGESIEHRVMRMRAWRHREMVRAERMERARIQGGQPSISQSEEESRGLLRGYASGMETLADVERRLSDLLEEEERHLNRSENDDWRASSTSISARRPTATAAVENEKHEDHWPVRVTLHEVNWDKMTVSGSMIASQILGQSRTAAVGPTEVGNKPDDSSMETLFDGEIIDFETHEFETVADKIGYRVGGLVTDIKYWSRIGPFKKELSRNIQRASEKKAKDTYDNLGLAGTLDQQKEEYDRTFKDQHAAASELDRDEVGMVVYETMADCLGSREWLGKAMGEDGWIFMRWKERCFISEPTIPSGSSESSTAAAGNEYTRFRTIVPRAYGDEQQLHHNPHDRTAWGLTIRGFYYVALHRQTGQIEALYYDSGSHPYQELTCRPASVQARVEGDQVCEGGDEDKDLIADLAKMGIRREFGTYEFR